MVSIQRIDDEAARHDCSRGHVLARGEEESQSKRHCFAVQREAVWSRHRVWAAIALATTDLETIVKTPSVQAHIALAMARSNNSCLAAGSLSASECNGLQNGFWLNMHPAVHSCQDIKTGIEQQERHITTAGINYYICLYLPPLYC